MTPLPGDAWNKAEVLVLTVVNVGTVARRQGGGTL